MAEKKNAAVQTVDTEAVQAAEAVPAGPDPNELVTVRLFRDTERYRDDVFVAVNGKRFQIKRGVEVQVPRYVKEVLDHSMNQDLYAAQMLEELVAKYKE